MLRYSYLKSVNGDYIEELYQRYLVQPDSVDESWRYFFDGLDLATEAPSSSEPQTGAALSELKVAALIQAYRERGKFAAQLDPLLLKGSSPQRSDLDPKSYGLTDADLSLPFAAGALVGKPHAKLSEILQLLKAAYCGTSTLEIAHLTRDDEIAWLRQKVESGTTAPRFDRETQKHILKRLTASETFERFLHTRYVAKKRFSIEGGESLIPAMDLLFERGSELGATHFVIGMAHRGRLNVLRNTFGKKDEFLLSEFEDNYKADYSKGDGDVKYHMGFETEVQTRSGKSLSLALAFNPSHLEFVNPVVEGMVRAKQTSLADRDRSRVVPLLVHGDAAVAGQGVVYETLGFAGVDAYFTGGTIHVALNNQVGFTTYPEQSRSTSFCTDVAKSLEAPIIHVNGDDAERVCWSLMLAMEYRQKFKRDIFIDLICYRKYGHNEGDEPSFTQPLMYKKIGTHPTPRAIYAEYLAQSGAVSATDAQGMVDAEIEKMTQAQVVARKDNPAPFVSSFEGRWKPFHKAKAEEFEKNPKTSVESKKLLDLATRLNTLPASFKLHPKLGRFFEARLKAWQEGKGIDWGNGEMMAYATLLTEGHDVRITGQDVERGTFTHRHAVVSDFESAKKHSPLHELAPGHQGSAHFHNSTLSETGVMGFEYGYSLCAPNSLVIWEGQFGDFANGAQVIIDQFLASGETKWQRSSGLVLLLPHGYEGQGPEHSSGRLERFLQLSAQNNWVVANFTTPAQLFHALRRQMAWSFRKPLVVMTPKSLLRHPQAVSTLNDFAEGSFQEVLDDPFFASGSATKSVKKVILCSGKVYYDLIAAREEKKKSTEIALLRIEQLFPWPRWALAQALKKYAGAKEWLWVQEEPRNMGAWLHVQGHWSGALASTGAELGLPALQYVGRVAAASPAVGSTKRHEKEQKELIEQALA